MSSGGWSSSLKLASRTSLAVAQSPFTDHEAQGCVSTTRKRKHTKNVLFYTVLPTPGPSLPTACPRTPRHGRGNSTPLSQSNAVSLCPHTSWASPKVQAAFHSDASIQTMPPPSVCHPPSAASIVLQGANRSLRILRRLCPLADSVASYSKASSSPADFSWPVLPA